MAQFDDDRLGREHPGTDQYAERKGTDDGNSRAIRSQSAREPAEAVRIDGTNWAVRRWDGVLLDRFWDRRTGHDGRIGLSRRWTALKFSILCGSKTSVNAIFHPQPPFSISRRQKLHAAKACGHPPGVGLAEDCAQPAEPLPSVLSARSRARVHKWLRLRSGRRCLFAAICAACPNSTCPNSTSPNSDGQMIMASAHSGRVKVSGCAVSGSSGGKSEPDSSRLQAAIQSVHRVRVRPKTSDTASTD